VDRVTPVASEPDTGRSVRAERSDRPPAVVHVDLDGASHIFRLHGWSWNGGVDPVYETGVPRALDLFEELGISATFFVIAEDLEDPAKFARLRSIVDRGHDIASHSLTHSPLRGLETADKQREIAESRDRIGSALGTVPTGFRAPNFSIDRECTEILTAAGYEYDSSVTAGDARAGFRIDRPGLLPSSIVELPLPPFRPLPFPFHPSYSLVLGRRYFAWGLSRFRRSGDPLILLFHLVDFADPLSYALAPGAARRLFTLSHRTGQSKMAACRAFLRTVRDRYRFTETRQLIAAVRTGEQDTSK
jgi:peptidoglycan/xylan/chitin deacetylase (PgdA/CDA1 family)